MQMDIKEVFLLVLCGSFCFFHASFPTITLCLFQIYWLDVVLGFIFNSKHKILCFKVLEQNKNIFNYFQCVEKEPVDRYIHFCYL